MCPEKILLGRIIWLENAFRCTGKESSQDNVPLSLGLEDAF